MMERAMYEDGVLVGHTDISWDELRATRYHALKTSDWRAVSDREMSDEWREYRQLLRDLPQNWPGENANDACDNYPIKPED